MSRSRQEIRAAFAGTSLSEIAVYDSLDVPDSAALKECAVQVLLTVGPSWEAATVREVNTPTSFDLLIRVLAPAERSALLSARTILPLGGCRRWPRERGVGIKNRSYRAAMAMAGQRKASFSAAALSARLSSPALW